MHRPAKILIKNKTLIPKLIGSRFWVQGLQSMDTAYPIDRDPEYPTYPIGCDGFVNTMKPELFRYKLFKTFQPRTLNPEPLNLSYRLRWITGRPGSRFHIDTPASLAY
jgi:hypothetical protein